MNLIPVQDVFFDDKATSAMGEAFDQACKSLRKLGSACTVREIIAKRIIASAKNGERDPARLCQQALIPFGIEDMSMLVVSVGPKPPSQPMLRSRTQRDPKSPVRPEPGSRSADSYIWSINFKTSINLGTF